MKNATSLLRTRPVPKGQSGTQVSLTPRRAGWELVGFSVRQIAGGDTWSGRTSRHEVCMVLLSGLASVTWSPDQRRAVLLGPRRDVFTDYPHAIYLPPGTAFEVRARRGTEMAVCQSPSAKRFPARLIRPEDCGLEVRGGGNATRQIIDILPPAAPADRLLVCEVLTPGGNWSSYPPHKHDRDALPEESLLEETYYHRIDPPHGFALQRVYTGDGNLDETLAVRDRDVVLVPRGYHTVSAPPGYAVYYLNVMAGPERTWAVANDPDHEWMLQP